MKCYLIIIMNVSDNIDYIELSLIVFFSYHDKNCQLYFSLVAILIIMKTVKLKTGYCLKQSELINLYFKFILLHHLR